MQTLEPKFVLLDANHCTTEHDWKELLVVFISPTPVKTGFKLPALLRRKTTDEQAYDIHAMTYEGENARFTELTKNVEQRIRHQYENSYLFGKDIFYVGFLHNQGEHSNE